MSAGGYHHHLGTNTWASDAPLTTDDDARLLDWELVLPKSGDVRAAASSIQGHGFSVAFDGRAATTRDPWGTQLRLVGASA